MLSPDDYASYLSPHNLFLYTSGLDDRIVLANSTGYTLAHLPIIRLRASLNPRKTFEDWLYLAMPKTGIDSSKFGSWDADGREV